ncbi:hypothetical protein QWY31_08640 [Cytophagales bacterium LB-30]|uniref:Lipoprotein n=1 Tax=Shiella aurantiaca TaxID=3058365 RepID=A0ABT8F5R1_9BACT|nr:hypothetical protein [Shiella aurantiaca]MDN4165566.1 hypothetical protein [Shiella aurantiaca]
MKKTTFSLCLLSILILSACGSGEKKANPEEEKALELQKVDSITQEMNEAVQEVESEVDSVAAEVDELLKDI